MQQAAKLGEQELDYRQDQAKQLFGLVQAGQLTGDQARQTLINQGINPQEFMTPTQVEDQQFRDRLSKTVQDPAVAALIDSEDELNFFMKNGRTFEDEIADIMSTRKDLAGWREKLPELQEQLVHYDKLIDREANKSSGWIEGLWGGGRDDKKLAEWKEKRAAIEQAINEVRAGKVPVYSA